MIEMDRHIYKAVLHRIGALLLEGTSIYTILYLYRNEIANQAVVITIIINIIGMIWYFFWEKLWDKKVKGAIIK